MSVKYPFYIKNVTGEVSEQVSLEAYHNFSQTCRSPSTRRIYEIGLHNFMDFLKKKIGGISAARTPNKNKVVIASEQYETPEVT
jgi:hypothetical protein